MKRKVIGGLCFAILMVVAVFLMSMLQYRSYVKVYNEKTMAMLEVMLRDYPDISSRELMKVLNGEETASDDIKKLLGRYGIDVAQSPVMMAGEKVYQRNLWICCGAAVLFAVALLAAGFRQEKKNKREKERITGYLEHINRREYQFDMEQLSEGSQSILENEVYKTTIMLKETAEREREDKLRVKDALSDISHQLKTPLTSLSITLDNLRDKQELSPEEKNILLRNATRDVSRMSQMIGQILTLSRLEANVISFQRASTDLSAILKNALDSVEAIADLKNIALLCDEEPGLTAVVDGYWESQAIANILKNGIEHADSRVQITVRNYSMYREITIENDGKNIPRADREKLFTRFYQGEGAGRESVGIGLSLAYVVIKQDGGHIFVDDAVTFDSGARFVIRYPAAERIETVGER